MARGLSIAAVEKIFDAEVPLSEFERCLVRDRFTNPRATDEEIGKPYGVSKQAVNAHFKKANVKSALLRLHADVISQIKALHIKAVKNYGEFLDLDSNDNAKLYIKYQASRDLLTPAINSPSALPPGRRELPTFVDGD